MIEELAPTTIDKHGVEQTPSAGTRADALDNSNDERRPNVRSQTRKRQAMLARDVHTFCCVSLKNFLDGLVIPKRRIATYVEPRWITWKPRFRKHDNLGACRDCLARE
jgi:hypothetical protein